MQFFILFYCRNPHNTTIYFMAAFILFYFTRLASFRAKNTVGVTLIGGSLACSTVYNKLGMQYDVLLRQTA